MGLDVQGLVLVTSTPGAHESSVAGRRPVLGRRDKPRQVREMLATLAAAKRVRIYFRDGPVGGIVLDSQSASEAERWDVAWLLVKTRGGHLGERFRAADRLRSQDGRASTGHYEIRSRAENAQDLRLFLMYNPEPAATPNPGGLTSF
jgi:hypothetical protein